MKKLFAMISVIIILCAVSCKNERDAEQPADTVLAKKYAKYRVAVRKEPELKTWVATLEKGEDIDLLSEISVPLKKGKDIQVAKVKLAGGTEGYVETRHLADKTVVFIVETPVFIRPTMGSKMHVKLPKGTMAFIVGEQADWVKVYAGKIQDKYVSEQWAQGGYSTEPAVILEARILEGAIAQASSDKSAERNDGIAKLRELGEGDGVLADVARLRLVELENKSTPEEAGKESATPDTPVNQ